MKKTAIVTGALGGIGKSICKVFRENGYYVVGIDKQIEGEIDYLDRSLNVDLFDYVNDETYRAKINDHYFDKISGVDVLINNAAVQILSSFDKLDLSGWHKTLDVNLSAPLYLTKYFYEKLAANRGSVINMASIHHSLTKPRFMSYATSKSALIGLTKAMSVDLKGKIRCNSVSPAAIRTPMLEEGFDGDKMALEKLDKLHPIQRIGEPEEVANLCLFLASDKAEFINGANIQIDGAISSTLLDLDV